MDDILKHLKIKLKDLLDESGQICYMTALQFILEKSIIQKMDIDTYDEFNYKKYDISLEIIKKLKCNNRKLEKESEKIQDELFLQELGSILENSMIKSFSSSTKHTDLVLYGWFQVKPVSHSISAQINQKYKIEFTVVKNF